MEDFNYLVDEYLSLIPKNKTYSVSYLNVGFGKYLQNKDKQLYNQFIVVYKLRQNRLAGFMRMLEQNKNIVKKPCGCSVANQKYLLKG